MQRFCYTDHMNEPPTIRTKQIVGLLLLAQMQRMGIARLLDAHFPAHSNNEQTVSKRGADIVHE
jgi:hypothetical protein